MLERKELFIVGAGGLGRDLLSFFKEDDSVAAYDWVGFIDDGLNVGRSIQGLKVVGNIDFLKRRQSAYALLAIGNVAIRKRVLERMQGSAIQFPTLIHSTSTVFDKQKVSLGMGNIIGPFCFLTTDITIGSFNVFHSGNSLHHDVEIGNHTLLMPGVRLYKSQKITEMRIEL